jgi:hydroxysqualene dehydroxylase
VDRLADLGVRSAAAVRLRLIADRSAVSLRVAIVGAGWSGLACALELPSEFDITLIDAAPQVGGRARRVDRRLGDRSYPLDNGQHLLIGAYRETLRLMREVGVDPEQALHRQPFVLSDGRDLHVQAAELPAPLHLAAALLRAHGLQWRSRLALVSFMRRLKSARWRAAPQTSVAELLRDQPSELVARLWRPLCLAALNVEPEEASAQVLVNILRDSLGASADASQLLIARRDLSATFADAAQRALIGRNASVHLRSIAADQVVLALPPWSAAALLGELPAYQAPRAQLQAIASAPIATVYLRYPAGTRLPQPMLALRDSVGEGDFAQWLFDRGAIDTAGEQGFDGVLAAVISGHGAHMELTRETLAQSVAAQLQRQLDLPEPLATDVLIEKRATIVPTPGLVRPGAGLAGGVYLAGDSADSDYPSTLEGSVRAGIAAAHALIADARAGAASIPNTDARLSPVAPAHR